MRVQISPNPPMKISIEKASGKAYCRGGCGYHKKIPSGTKCLKVSIHGAGGYETAFYCEEHMLPVFEAITKVLSDFHRDI